MKKVLLSLIAGVALAGYVDAQTNLVDFETKVPYQYTFGGSNFSVVDNPSKTGVNTSNKVAMTQKAASGAETWGGCGFPVGGTITFAPGSETFTMDVYSAVAGKVNLKVEIPNTETKIDMIVNYTTPGAWETLTFNYPGAAAGTYTQIVTFLGFDSKATDVWYYDNIKGPGIAAGAPVDVTFSLSDLGGTVTSSDVELSNAPGTKLPLTGTAGVGATWTKVLTAVTGSTITDPITYTWYVNGEATADPNQPFTMAGSTPAVIAKNYGSAPVGVNLITNGTFDGIEGALPGSTGKAWGAWTGNGGTVTIQNGVALCSAVASNDAWQLQLEQKNFAIENGKSYAASFEAHSVDLRNITLSIEDPANGYALLGTTTDADGLLNSGDGLLHSKWDIAITDVKTTYTRTITVDKVKANTETKFVFLLAQAADLVYIDNVSLKEVTNVSVGENKASTVKFYPNPAQNEIYFTGKDKLRKVSVYNVVGAQVKEFKNVSESLNISDLKPGVYMVKVTDENGKTSTTKILKK